MKFLHNVLVEKGAHLYPQTGEILSKLRGQPVRETDHDTDDSWSKQQMDMDKQTLRIMPYRGEFLKPCPGTNGYICCGYMILNVGTNCPMDCSYCILQAYFNQPSLRIFINLESELDHIGRILDSQPDRIFRIGTGEFTDSLALDDITGWSITLSEFFQGRKNSVLELKTKTDRIDNLLASPYRDRMIISWSLNSHKVAAREEHGAAGIEKRLRAARQCQEEGYVIGFHFDPIIHYPGWKEDYLRTLDLMDHYMDPKGIIWISLGCFRYMPVLKSIIRRRHPKTGILNGEFVRGMDGKMRYFKPIRMDIYAFMTSRIEAWKKDSGLYLCMESDEIWNRSLGRSPVDSLGLARYLDERVRMFFET